LYARDYEGAIQDFNELAGLKLSWGFYHRGLARFFMGQFEAAKEDFALSGEGPYSDIWMYLADAQAGKKAKDELKEKAPRIARQLKSWPGPVISFYLGSLTPAQVVAAARAEDLTDQSPCFCDNPNAAGMPIHLHHTEGAAYFYLGESTLLRGHSEDAKPLFQKAVSMAARNSEEHQAAVLELGRMAAAAPKKRNR
jgi:lipoprotein NlpI